MKTVRFLFAIVGLGALTLGPGFAQPSGAPEKAPYLSRPDGKRWDQQQGESHASGTSSRAGGTRAAAKGHAGPKLPQLFQGNGGRPGQKPTNNARSKSISGHGAELHRPGLNQSAGGAKAGSMINEMESRRRLFALGLSGAPPPSLALRYRGHGLALLGGSALSSAGNTAAINGTGMRRKP
jgi:hypothetical protein